MSKFGDILKAGAMGGLAGAAMKAGKVGIGDIARMGGLGVAGMALAKKKKKGAAGKPGGAEEVVAMEAGEGMKRGGKVKKMAKGGSASRRGDGCATQGKTRGKFV
jgi:hypothetical protein